MAAAPRPWCRRLHPTHCTTGAALDALVADKVSTAGWSVSGAVVCLPKNGYNQPVTKRAQDLIKFDQISSVLKSITVGM